MNLTMKKILEKFNDCDMFSLTGVTSCANFTMSQEELKYNITDEEFSNALKKIEDYEKETNRKIYEQNKEKFKNYPKYDELYEEIKNECCAFDSEPIRKIYIQKYFDEKQIEQYMEMGFSIEKINEMKKDFFRCSFIADTVGKITKYGNENTPFFWNLYHSIAMTIDRQKDREKYVINSGISPIEQVPLELKEHLLYYEASYYNTVTVSSNLMINYYFKLNDETKKYLLEFENDFCLNELQDLTLYKNKEINFYSCTHESFNSIETD